MRHQDAHRLVALVAFVVVVVVVVVVVMLGAVVVVVVVFMAFAFKSTGCFSHGWTEHYRHVASVMYEH